MSPRSYRVSHQLRCPLTNVCEANQDLQIQRSPVGQGIQRPLDLWRVCHLGILDTVFAVRTARLVPQVHIFHLASGVSLLDGSQRVCIYGGCGADLKVLELPCWRFLINTPK
jgi:hypothetical protein